MRRNPLTTETAPAAARRWLARRDYSEAELQARLEREGLEAAEARALVAELADGWWQSDSRFAQMLVRQRLRQGKGPRLIAAELSTHQLSDADIRLAFEEAEPDWEAAALEALRRCRSSEPQKRQQFLLRKGFSGEQIRQAMRAVDSDAID